MKILNFVIFSGISLLTAVYSADDDGGDDGGGVDDDTCYVTGRRASYPKVGLEFCSMFRTNSCCDPAIDSQIQDYYEELLYVSDLCASTRTNTHIALQYIFCFACHPKQWKYTNMTSQVIRLCPNIANQADPAGFDDCGINIPGERGDLCSGSDSAIPSLYYSDDPDERIEMFFNDPTTGLPPYFEDFSVEVCDPEDEECMANCYQIDSGPILQYSVSILALSLFLSTISLLL